jgi:putative membrane protein
MMFWDGSGWGWGGWLLMTLSMVAFWGLVIGTLVVLLRGNRSGGPGAPAKRPVEHIPAEQILAERYARGEIEEDEYRHRLDVLHGRHGPTGLTKVG